MTLWLVVLVAVLLWVGTSARRAPARHEGAPERRGSSIGIGAWIALVVLAIVLARVGLHWLAVVGGAALALGRGLVPLVRLLPFLQALRGADQRSGRGVPRDGERGDGARPPAARPSRMTREEALQVLGLSATATAEDVRREYRRLMKKMHPDLGGSSYLAAKLNEARDVLS